jgi:hypothetical protein
MHRIVHAGDVRVGDHINTSQGRSPVTKIDQAFGSFFFHTENGDCIPIANSDGEGRLEAYPPERTRPIVVVVRDPDSSNDFTVFNGDVEIHDLDLGYMNLDDPEEWAEWADGHLEAAQQFEDNGHPAVAALIRDVVHNADPEAR